MCKHRFNLCLPGQQISLTLALMDSRVCLRLFKVSSLPLKLLVQSGILLSDASSCLSMKKKNPTKYIPLHGSCYSWRWKYIFTPGLGPVETNVMVHWNSRRLCGPDCQALKTCSISRKCEGKYAAISVYLWK